MKNKRVRFTYSLFIRFTENESYVMRNPNRTKLKESSIQRSSTFTSPKDLFRNPKIKLR